MQMLMRMLMLMLMWEQRHWQKHSLQNFVEWADGHFGERKQQSAGWN